jgi:DMSO reductase family type II enzyme heme b subunit
MGDPEHPVAIWQWTADLEADALGRGAFAKRYPHTQGVWYFPQDDSVRRKVRAWRGSDPVVEFVATGWGTLTLRESGEVRASSRHTGKGWRVLLRRRLATGNPEHAAFQPGDATQLIVAVWNGSKRDVNGRKSVTLGWTPFALDATVEGHASR